MGAQHAGQKAAGLPGLAVKLIGERHRSAAAAHSSRTLPVTRVVTLSNALGFSTASRRRASSDSFRSYCSAMASACSQVEWSGQAGPEAIMSSGSPRISLSTTANTRAGAQARANRPPLTRDSRLRMASSGSTA